MALGNTGSGKSTMLNALVFGPDVLEATITPTKKRVIEQKKEFQSSGQFKIGHSVSKSQTFRPELIYSEEMKCYFIDVAGYMDTHGPFFDILSSFVIKYIFENAKTVKFICPFTFDEIGMERGKVIRELLTQLQQMSKNHLVTIVDSIIPVVTKCRAESKIIDYDKGLI